MIADSSCHPSDRVFFIAVLFFLLPANTLQASETVADPSECTAIQSSLNRLACFDSYFKTPVHSPNNTKKPAAKTDYKPEILKLVQRTEKNRPPETAGLLIQKAVDHEASKQDRIILSAPAIGAYPPRPLLVISCMNNITRLQIGFDQSLAEHSARITLTLDGRSIGGDYLWQIIEARKIVDAGRGIPSITILKTISKYQRLMIQSDTHSLNGLTFDISGLKQALPAFRKACHW